ncbi:MAG: hypothetical protein F6K16_15945 [Symploca sp. SIO2B6]|nr:hypothetical protein [Symploca sp. SIO2B6]
MLILKITLLLTGLWAVWTSLKACEQVYGITLLLSGLILVVWGLSLAPLWLQIAVEMLLIFLVHLFSNLYRPYRRIPLSQVTEVDYEAD